MPNASGVVAACSAPLGGGGLGRHLAEVVHEARSAGQLLRYFAATVPNGDDFGTAVRLRWFPWLARFSPARFIPEWKAHLGSEEFDRRVAAALPPGGGVLTGFAGMALHSFRQARRLGYRLLRLESPTAHIQHVWDWNARAHRRHPIEGSWLGRRQRDKVQSEYDLADEIVVNSEHARQTFLDAGTPPAKLRRRVLTVDPRFHPPPDRPTGPGGLRVVYVGSLAVTKGVPILLEAFARFDDLDARLTLVGGTGTRGMRRYLTAALARDRRVRVCPGDPLPHLWAADVAVHPSYQDGFGYAPMEALACGVPVIVTDQTGMKEYVREGVNGYVVPAGDADALLARLAAIGCCPPGPGGLARPALGGSA
ncbi:MAG TPA: glycosyltransferase [Gemmataceae bacterium]|nr:glycosyltransferase [Gemmataceae bacterium]